MPYKNKKRQMEYQRKKKRDYRRAERQLLDIAKFELTPQWKWICKSLGIHPKTPKRRSLVIKPLMPKPKERKLKKR